MLHSKKDDTIKSKLDDDHTQDHPQNEALEDQPHESNNKEIQNPLEDLETKNEQLKEENLGLLAEIDNMRKRMNKELSHQTKFGISKMAYDVLDPLDNFERARNSVSQEEIKKSPKSIENIIIGLDMVLKQFHDLLSKNGVTVIPLSKGDDFNPDIAEIFEQIGNTDKKIKSGNILQIVRPGYKLHDRLLRPAMVTVKK